MTMSDCADVFAVPGERSIIDVVRPDTGRSWCYGHDLNEIQARYPAAVRMPYADWAATAIAAQDTPITFTPTTEDQYHEMLNVLPPAAWVKDCFLVGEPTDHAIATGRPRYQMYRMRAGHTFDASSRPVTKAEFRAIVDTID